MAKGHITKRLVDAVQPGRADQFIWDDEISGFGLKVTPSGGKVYVFQYRLAPPGEASRTSPTRYTIGRHGALTPEQARKSALALAALVANGVDPRQLEIDQHAAKREAQNAANEKARLEGELSFENIAALWLEHYEHEKERRPTSVRQARLVVNRHLKPRLTGKPLPHIARSDLQAAIDAIPVAQRGMRRAVFAYASVLFGWAVKRGHIDANPLAGMAKPEAPKARDRVLNDDELAAVWRAASALGKPFGPFFRLLILTGQRRSEVAGIGWGELDRETAAWTIPAIRAKNGVAHIVPISGAVIAELDALAGIPAELAEDERKWPRKGLLLSTTGTTPISGITKAKDALDAAVAKAREGERLPHWRIHDLRRTVATGFQRLGVRFEVTEAVLNHVSGAKSGIAGVYQRHDWKDEKRSALEGWARHMAGILQPAERDNVLSIGGAKTRA